VSFFVRKFTKNGNRKMKGGNMKEKFVRFFKEEEGTETVEWAIIIGLIAVAAIGIILGIGSWVTGKFSSLYSAVSSSS
jgi:pilus assembly protein Flp/PilA